MCDQPKKAPSVEEPSQKTAICVYCQGSFPRSHMVNEHIVPRFLPTGKARKGVLKICLSCSQERAVQQHAEYLGFKVSQNRDSYASFLERLYEVEALTHMQVPDDRLRVSLANLLFVHVITAMETYLSDTYINRIMADETLLRCLIETNPDFRNKKLDLADLFVRLRGLKDEVRAYLLELIYHNLAKVRPMYESVLDVKFPRDLSGLFRAVLTRHDIVHRGGKSKTGVTVGLSYDDVRNLIQEVKTFVGGIDRQLSSLEIDPSPEGGTA